MRRHGLLAAVVTAVLGSLLPATPVPGCPFCASVSQTFAEEIATMDAVVIAELVRLPGTAGTANAASNMAHFSIVKILKGEDLLGAKANLSTVFYGDAKKGDRFLVMGVDPPQITWSTPLPLNDRQHQYLIDLVALPKEGIGRLVFFQKYLEDADQMLSQDAYDEFARAPYAVVKELKSSMDHDQLVAWIVDPKVLASRRRLYLTMLGVCGGKDDLPMLEDRLKASDLQSRSGLDALIACYLTLRGPDGVALIEDLFLKKKEGNFSDNYADIYAAIMALRFHGTEGNVVPRARVLQAFGHILDNPQMADLVIPDLARWEDWSQLERLVELFKSADVKTSYVRMPIINFVRVCPRAEAKKALEEFEKIDPDAVKRSMTFFPAAPKDSK